MTKDEFQKAVDDVITDCIRNDYSFGSYAYKATEAVWPLLEAAEKERDWHAERCEDAMNECDALRAALRHEADCVEACKSEIERLRAKLEAAEKTNREWLRANAPGGWIDNLRIENEALRAEVIHIKEVEFPRKAQAVADGWRSKCERLEAKIAEMERQEPYSYIYEYVNPIDGSPVWRNVPGYWNAQYPRSSKPLYALPGAKGEEE